MSDPVLALSVLALLPASFQQSMQVLPVPGPVRDAGVYHLATGTWTRGGGHENLGPKILYANTVNTGFFGVMGGPCDLVWTDEGRIPSTSGHPNAKDDSYVVQSFQIAYVTYSLSGPQRGALELYECYAACSNPAALTPVFSMDLALPNANGGGWIVTFDLKGTSFEFEIAGDCDESFDGSTSLDDFGWTLTLEDQGTGGFNGPFLNGDPNNFPYGDGTYYQNSAAPYATGLGTQDQYWLTDSQGCAANGCYWFGNGYLGGDPYASFWLELGGENSSGDPLGTKYCAATANSTGAPADISASGTSAAAGDIALTSAPVPNQPGIFFHGPSPDGVPFGNGVRCVGGQLVRGAVTVGAGNTATYPYDNSDSKHSLLSQVGILRHFQHWFRDPLAGGAAFNLSDGVVFIVP